MFPFIVRRFLVQREKCMNRVRSLSIVLITQKCYAHSVVQFYIPWAQKFRIVSTPNRDHSLGFKHFLNMNYVNNIPDYGHRKNHTKFYTTVSSHIVAELSLYRSNVNTLSTMCADCGNTESECTHCIITTLSF